jgi:hypothetical protein
MENQRVVELRRAQVDTMEIRSDGDLVTPLLEFFKRRSRK